MKVNLQFSQEHGKNRDHFSHSKPHMPQTGPHEMATVSLSFHFDEPEAGSPKERPPHRGLPGGFVTELATTQIMHV